MTPARQITTPEPLPDERGADASLRPSRLDEFVGQAKVKENLQIAIDAARQRSEPLDHALFFGPPGLGKTTLAILLAKEMGVSIRTTTGPVLERPGDLVGLLTGLQRGRHPLHRRGAPAAADAGGVPLSGDGGLARGRAHQRGAARRDDPDGAGAASP